MSSIIRFGDTYHGISVFGRGMFTNHGHTYAGQCKDGYACGLGVTTYRHGSKKYAEHGPDGKYDGRYLHRDAGGYTFYRLYERGKAKEYAVVLADGTCTYNHVVCAPDDPRLLVLMAQVAPVEVRPAARAPHPQLPPTRPQAIVRPARFAAAGARRRRGHRGAPARRTPSLVSVRHTPTAAKHSHAAARVRAGLTWGAHGRWHFFAP